MYNSKCPSVCLNLYRITHDKPKQKVGQNQPQKQDDVFWVQRSWKIYQVIPKWFGYKMQISCWLAVTPTRASEHFLIKMLQHSASCCFGRPVTPELVGNLYQRLASCITSSIHCFNNRENSASSNCHSHQSFNPSAHEDLLWNRRTNVLWAEFVKIVGRGNCSLNVRSMWTAGKTFIVSV